MTHPRVSVGRLKARLSEYLRQATSGRGVIVTDRGKPVARLVGLDGEAEREARITELMDAGLAAPPQQPLDLETVFSGRPSDPEGRSIQIVLEERAEGL